MVKLISQQVKAPFVPDLKNWEANFDEEFIKEKIRKSTLQKKVSKQDIDMIEQFRSEFSQMNFNKDAQNK